ncbi:hypothetical protein UT300016_05300 [Clostridium senegalense]
MIYLEFIKFAETGTLNALEYKNSNSICPLVQQILHTHFVILLMECKHIYYKDIIEIRYN